MAIGEHSTAIICGLVIADGTVFNASAGRIEVGTARAGGGEIRIGGNDAVGQKNALGSGRVGGPCMDRSTGTPGGDRGIAADGDAAHDDAEGALFGEDRSQPAAEFAKIP